MRYISTFIWRKARILCIGLALASTAISASAAPLYAVRDLGSLGGTGSEALAINAAGSVVGRTNTDSISRAAQYSASGNIDLGTITGPSSAYGINNAGLSVGISQGMTGGSRAVLFRGDGTLVDLNPGIFSQAWDINDGGKIAGSAQVGGSLRATLFDATTGVVTDLGSTGTSSEARALNNAGQAVGATYSASGYRATFFNSGSSPVDLGTVGGSSSFALDVNNAGQAVGWSFNTSNSQRRATLFSLSGGPAIDIGTLGGGFGLAWAINDAGQVVGTSTTASARTEAFLWEDGVMLSLNTLIDSAAGWDISEAMDINEAGQIAANATRRGDMSTHAVLLTPLSMLQAEVPEPSSLALVVVALIGLGFKRKKNCRQYQTAV